MSYAAESNGSISFVMLPRMCLFFKYRHWQDVLGWFDQVLGVKLMEGVSPYLSVKVDLSAEET